MDMFTKARTPGNWRWEFKDPNTLLLRGKNGALVAEFRSVSAYDAGALETVPQLIDALTNLLANPENQKARQQAQKVLDLASTPWAAPTEIEDAESEKAA